MPARFELPVTVSVMCNVRENTKDYDRQLKFVVFNLEAGIKLMGPGVEQMTIVVDYKNVNVMNSPPLSISKRFLDIVSNHYPEVSFCKSILTILSRD